MSLTKTFSVKAPILKAHVELFKLEYFAQAVIVYHTYIFKIITIMTIICKLYSSLGNTYYIYLLLGQIRISLYRICENGVDVTVIGVWKNAHIRYSIIYIVDV